MTTPGDTEAQTGPALFTPEPNSGWLADPELGGSHLKTLLQHPGTSREQYSGASQGSGTKVHGQGRGQVENQVCVYMVVMRGSSRRAGAQTQAGQAGLQHQKAVTILDPSSSAGGSVPSHTSPQSHPTPPPHLHPRTPQIPGHQTHTYWSLEPDPASAREGSSATATKGEKNPQNLTQRTPEIEGLSAPASGFACALLPTPLPKAEGSGGESGLV